MKYLLIDTSVRSTLCIAVNDGETFIFDNAPKEGENTSMNIIPNVDQALGAAGLTPLSLDCIAAVVGPGSFTGLRIGVSVANAMGTLGCRMLGVNLLDALKEDMPDDTLAALPSRAGYCYTDRGEFTVDEVAAASHSVGVEGTGAKVILDRSRYAQKLLTYMLRHAPQASQAPIEPLYLKKSQAERLREATHD